MIRDLATELSSDQSLINGIGTVTSTNVYDTGVDGGDAGVGEPFGFLFEITESVVGVGASVSFQLQTSDDEAFGSGNVTAYQSPATAVADLAKGAQFKAKAPLGLKRYVRGQYVITGAAVTAGKVTTGVVKDLDAWRAYNLGVSF